MNAISPKRHYAKSDSFIVYIDAVYRPETRIRETFEDMVINWQMETSLLSDINQITDNKWFKGIVSAGNHIIPQLIEHLGKNPSLLVLALNDITGENPVRKRNMGNVVAMVNDWREWQKSSYAETN